ncbi:MAG TPA: hypothetical protein VNA25_29280 [Phycisphaerae bacterium]|nr:hypothetical protein [Phycisphaerae bacterium]
MRPWSIGIAILGLLTSGLAAAEPVKIADPEDAPLVKGFLGHVAKVPDYLSAERCRKMAADQPEGYTWMLSPSLSMPLTAYELTGDPEYLEMFVQCFENMRSALTKGPDGYLGWYGKALSTFQDPKDPDKKVDVVVTSFRISDIVCRFIENIDAAAPMKAKYAAKRTEYLDLIENNLVKKWEARGNYVDLGATGAIYRTHAGLKDVKGHLTQPPNKHSIIIQCLLRLHRVTGRDEYARKAVKIGTRYKHCLTLKDGHYEWNYWDPAGAWDVKPGEPDKWKHWIGVEHKGGYYATSLTQAVVLYQHGLVFDKSDIDRFVKTQLQVAWNGDLANPKWARVDGTTSDKYMQGQYICAALAPFAPKVYEFCYTGARQDERVKNIRHSWQGGPVLNGWLKAKLVDLPRARLNNQPYLQVGKAFLAKDTNRQFADSLAFAVSGTGYAPPRAPQQMKPMPPEPKR